MPTQFSSIMTFIRDYWPNFAGGSGFIGLLAAVWNLHQRRMNVYWAQEVVTLYRRVGTPVQVFLYDRKHLDWAVREGLLCIVETFKGGWLVAEQMQLGNGTVGSR